MKNAVIKSLYESFNKPLNESYEYWTEEDWARKLKKVCHLNKEEADDLLHDLNNLRGNEWLEIVEDNCDDEELLIAFKEFIGANDIWEDEFDESLDEAKTTFANIFMVQNRYDYCVELGLEKQAKSILQSRGIDIKGNQCIETPYSALTGAYIDLYNLTREENESFKLKEDYNSDLETERKVQKYLDDHNLWGEVSVQDGTVYVEIHWGDWKHDHWYCQDLMSELGYVLVGKEITEEDGSDTFSAIHTYEKLDVNEE